MKWQRTAHMQQQALETERRLHTEQLEHAQLGGEGSPPLLGTGALPSAGEGGEGPERSSSFSAERAEQLLAASPAFGG